MKLFVNCLVSEGVCKLFSSLFYVASALKATRVTAILDAPSLVRSCLVSEGVCKLFSSLFYVASVPKATRVTVILDASLLVRNRIRLSFI